MELPLLLCAQWWNVSCILKLARSSVLKCITDLNIELIHLLGHFTSRGGLPIETVSMALILMNMLSSEVWLRIWRTIDPFIFPVYSSIRVKFLKRILAIGVIATMCILITVFTVIYQLLGERSEQLRGKPNGIK
ncbi:hypothetical protein EI94DRAFT_1704086 [Lactarius quietus]|nr:hypothetical protein EI94DRAFT_1704086 [Lactarius quietus]